MDTFSQCIFILLLFLQTQVINVLANNMTNECRQIGYDLEDDFRSFVLIDKKNPIPNDEKSMNQYCNTAKAIPKKMKQFKKCLTNKLSQQMINLIVPSLTKAVRKMCVLDRKDAMRNLKCIKPQHKSVIGKCFNQYSNQLKYASDKLGTVQQMLPLICCGYLQAKQCIRQQLKDVCNGQADAGGYLGGMADALGKEMIGVACSKHSTKQQCGKHGLDSQLDLAAKHKFPQFKLEFIILPFIRASERMIKSND